MHSLCFVKSIFTSFTLHQTAVSRLPEYLRAQVLVAPQSLIIWRYKLASQWSIPHSFLGFSEPLISLVTFPGHEQDVLGFGLLPDRNNVVMVFPGSVVLLLLVMPPGVGIVLIEIDVGRVLGLALALKQSDGGGRGVFIDVGVRSRPGMSI